MPEESVDLGDFFEKKHYSRPWTTLDTFLMLGILTAYALLIFWVLPLMGGTK